MAEGRSRGAAHKSATATGRASARSGDVKMVKRHKEFQEADVEATQAADATTYEGKNPYRPGTAAWMGWENIKRQSKGQPATNAVATDTITTNEG